MFSEFSVILSHSNIANCYLLGSIKREYAWKVKKYSHKWKIFILIQIKCINKWCA